MKKILIKFFLFQYRLINKYRLKKYGNPENIELEKKHLQGAKLIPNRTALLELLPTNAVCAEIGVDEGVFSEEILKITKPKELHLIDIWEGTNYHQKKYDIVVDKFKANDNIKVNKCDSVLSANQFSDQFFDFIYLDTSKTYNQTLNELRAFKSKVKDGGYICGHDFTDGSWVNLTRWRVKEAVRLFCMTEGYKFVYLTQEKNGYESYCITKI